MKKLGAVVFVLITLVVMVLFSRAQDREQQLVNDRYKAACDFYFSVVAVDVANDFDVHRCMLRWNWTPLLLQLLMCAILWRITTL